MSSFNPAEYGVHETNPIESGYHDEPIERTLDLSDPELVRIIRLRLISDPGFPVWEVSYCHGETATGERVRVSLPFYQLRKGRQGPSINAQLVEHFRSAGRFGKGMGVFGAVSTMV
jgi:hypothetical protein